MSLIEHIATRPFLRWTTWVLFAFVFFQSGLITTTWLLDPDSFQGGWSWLWVIVFPVLLLLFFFVNRHLGCASGRCSSGGGSAQLRLPPGH